MWVVRFGPGPGTRGAGLGPVGAREWVVEVLGVLRGAFLSGERDLPAGVERRP